MSGRDLSDIFVVCAGEEKIFEKNQKKVLTSGKRCGIISKSPKELIASQQRNEKNLKKFSKSS